MNKKAMKLALEAMEQAHDASLDENHFECRQILMGQITVVREALAEQPAQQEHDDPIGDAQKKLIAEQALQQEPGHNHWEDGDVFERIAKLKKQPAQQEPFTDRENTIIRLALHQFMSNAYSHMNAAAQDKDGRRYTLGAVEKFAKDAKDAEALLSQLQFKAPPAPAQPLTDDQKAAHGIKENT
jgi:hypothetical protein